MGCDMFTLIRHIIIYKKNCAPRPIASCPSVTCVELELELILSQMAQKPMLRVPTLPCSNLMNIEAL